MALCPAALKESASTRRGKAEAKELPTPFNPPPPTTLFFVGATCCHFVTSEAVSSKATVANAVKLKLRVATLLCSRKASQIL